MVNGPNMYAYCGNNPVNLIDPWGLETGGTGGEDGTGENPSGGDENQKCPDEDEQPTNPDEAQLDVGWC